MMVRLWIVAAVAILGVALGGCGDARPGEATGGGRGGHKGPRDEGLPPTQR
jgi:hypothetical protein